MTTITPFMLSYIKRGLRIGDINRIATLSGYTPQTVQKSLKGNSIDHAAKIIIPIALDIVNHNIQESIAIYEAGKREFERQKIENP